MILRDTKKGWSGKVMLIKELTDFLEKVINKSPYSEYVFSK
jgi:hypothetical protein